MNSPIDKLEREVWHYCVRQKAAGDDETLNCWRLDERAHLMGQFIILPLPLEFNGLVEKAFSCWRRIEENLCSGLGMDNERFLREFTTARDNYINHNWHCDDSVMRFQTKVYGVVRNMGWVDLFSWVLPQATSEYHTEIKSVGIMLTAVFYFELLFKNIHNGDGYEDDALRRIEARWQLVNEII